LCLQVTTLIGGRAKDMITKRNYMNKEEILISLLELIANTYKIPESILIPQNFNEPLTGNKFSFDGILMTYLFFDVQKKFNVNISAEQILNYEFNTINGVIELIEKALIR